MRTSLFPPFLVKGPHVVVIGDPRMRLAVQQKNSPSIRVAMEMFMQLAPKFRGRFRAPTVDMVDVLPVIYGPNGTGQIVSEMGGKTLLTSEVLARIRDQDRKVQTGHPGYHPKPGELRFELAVVLEWETNRGPAQAIFTYPRDIETSVKLGEWRVSYQNHKGDVIVPIEGHSLFNQRFNHRGLACVFTHVREIPGKHRRWRFEGYVTSGELGEDKRHLRWCRQEVFFTADSGNAVELYKPYLCQLRSYIDYFEVELGSTPKPFEGYQVEQFVPPMKTEDDLDPNQVFCQKGLVWEIDEIFKRYNVTNLDELTLEDLEKLIQEASTAPLHRYLKFRYHQTFVGFPTPQINADVDKSLHPLFEAAVAKVRAMIVAKAEAKAAEGGATTETETSEPQGEETADPAEGDDGAKPVEGGAEPPVEGADASATTN